MRDTGWGWEQTLDELTAPRLKAFMQSWKRCPPLHRIMANYAGYKQPDDDKTIKQSPVFIATPEDARRQFRVTQGKVPGVGNG